MKRYLITILIIATALLVSSCAASTKKATPDSSHLAKPTSQKFQQLTRLEGKWKGTSDEGKGPEPVEVDYELSSGGSVILETLFKNSPHEMIGTYHDDGDKISYTHYCGLGNQPRMVSAQGISGGQIRFDFVNATNMASSKDPHMHALTITFLGDNKIRQDWTHYENGKPAGTKSFEFTRVQ